MKLKLSKELFDKGKSKKGAWNKKQFEALGVEYPLRSGWYDRLIGQEFEIPVLEKFLELKDDHLKGAEGKIYPPPKQCYVAPDNDCPPEYVIAECPFDLRRGETLDNDFQRATAGL